MALYVSMYFVSGSGSQFGTFYVNCDKVCELERTFC